MQDIIKNKHTTTLETRLQHETSNTTNVYEQSAQNMYCTSQATSMEPFVNVCPKTPHDCIIRNELSVRDIKPSTIRNPPRIFKFVIS